MRLFMSCILPVRHLPCSVPSRTGAPVSVACSKTFGAALGMSFDFRRPSPKLRACSHLPVTNPAQSRAELEPLCLSLFRRRFGATLGLSLDFRRLSPKLWACSHLAFCQSPTLSLEWRPCGLISTLDSEEGILADELKARMLAKPVMYFKTRARFMTF